MQTDNVELVVDIKTGQVRQAGADRPEGRLINEFRAAAQKSLFVFAKGVLGYSLLTKSLHEPVSKLMQQAPPYRKLFLLPRDHLKTTLAKSMALHMIIQEDGSNSYFPEGIGNLGHGRGTSTRILLGSKTADLARSTLSAIMTSIESNSLLRALWPQCFWEDPRRQAKHWNADRILLPRIDNFKEATIETIGVGGTITGYHFNVHSFDDLIDIEDANSPTVLLNAIEWHQASRSLMDDPDKSLEVITGTRWAVGDLYERLEREDSSVSVYKRAAIEDGQPIFPERFSLSTLTRLHRELGPRFALLYMNSAADPELTDFDPAMLRIFEVKGDELVFNENEHDLLLQKRLSKPRRVVDSRNIRGKPLNRQTYEALIGREMWFKHRRPKA